MGRDSRANIAKQTISIGEKGSYQLPSGNSVDIKARVDEAVRGTKLYRPDELEDMLAAAEFDAPSFNEGDSTATKIEVTDETTGAAARRLLQDENEPELMALNFASAKNPGGGFQGGARAQEEDLARCSALYHCLITQMEYYEINRAEPSMLYTDHMIYSPGVPFFRDEEGKLIKEPFYPAMITAPAPNAGEALKRDPNAGDEIAETFMRRVGMVLAIARTAGHRRLVLGAWGCGVFRNDPHMVAECFRAWLEEPRFQGAFERVVFAVYDTSRDASTRQAFLDCFQ